MLKKRLIGVVTVKDGWAVQSFGYHRYLPLGKPEVVVQNLDRWGADEILVQCIDRSTQGLGPDFEVLGKISKLAIATPLIYSGGISRREDAVKVVSLGADRIMVDAMLLDASIALQDMARDLGIQAIIGHVSAEMVTDGLKALDYRDGFSRPLADWLQRLQLEWISELMITDWVHEGHPDSFDERLLAVAVHVDKPLILFGGISQPMQIQRLLAHVQVVAVGVGNFLNYREHAMQALKQQLESSPMRAPHYGSSL